jgi:hypothetical protein
VPQEYNEPAKARDRHCTAATYSYSPDYRPKHLKIRTKFGVSHRARQEVEREWCAEHVSILLPKALPIQEPSKKTAGSIYRRRLIRLKHAA